MKHIYSPDLHSVVVISLLCVPAIAKAAEPLTRLQFAQNMAKVTDGMPEKQVLALLGKPDDVRTHHDPGGFIFRGTREIWCYGTNGHFTFPTLGCIYIDAKGKAELIYGGDKPPQQQAIEEQQLRQLLRIIDRAPPLDGRRFDPLPVIQIVNALQGLGKEKALAVIDEYLRVAPRWQCDAREGLFVVLRVLFEIPQDIRTMPHMYMGEPSPTNPGDATRLPRFPVVLVDDIPLFLISGYSLVGVPQSVEEHVEYFRKQGRLRAKPLRPTNVPLSVLDQLQPTFRWFYGVDERWRVDGKLMIINQLLRLVDSVYRLDPDREGHRFSERKQLENRWKSLVVEFDKLNVRWNEQKHRYTFKDGSTLPDPETKR